MSVTNILWGQVLLVSLVVLGFIWAATEWTAWRLAFQPEVGAGSAEGPSGGRDHLAIVGAIKSEWRALGSESPPISAYISWV